MGTDLPSVFKEDILKTIGFDMVERVANNLYKETGYGPKDVQVKDCIFLLMKEFAVLELNFQNLRLLNYMTASRLMS